MKRLHVVMALLIGVGVARAQSGNSIAWLYNARQAVDTAQRTGRPLLFYLTERTGSHWDGDYLKQIQNEAFRDPRVVSLTQRFVPVRISASAYADQLKKWGLNTKVRFLIVISTPDGRKLATISSGKIAQPEALARDLHAAFTRYRDEIFKDELLPVLKKDPPATNELRTALRRIEALQILSADKSLVELLDQTDLDRKLKPEIYQLLAKLSTPAGAAALLRAAEDDKAAAEALDDCTPGAAEHLLADLGDRDPQRNLRTYKAVTRICQIPGIKSDVFWKSAPADLKEKEIERVRDLVRKAATRWNAQNPYR